MCNKAASAYGAKLARTSIDRLYTRFVLLLDEINTARPGGIPCGPDLKMNKNRCSLRYTG